MTECRTQLACYQKVISITVWMNIRILYITPIVTLSKIIASLIRTPLPITTRGPIDTVGPIF